MFNQISQTKNFFQSSNFKFRYLLINSVYLLLILLLMFFFETFYGISMYAKHGGAYGLVFILYSIFTFPFLFKKTKMVNVDFNSREFEIIEINEKISFDKIIITEFDKTNIPFLGFQLVISDDLENNSFYFFSSYSKSDYIKFEREFNTKVNSDIDKYLAYVDSKPPILKGGKGFFRYKKE